MQKFPAEKILELFQEMEFIQRTETVIFIPIQIRLLLWQTLQEELERTGVEVHTGVRCLEIRREKMDLRSVRREKSFQADRVILCAGSKAAPVTGSDGSGV